MTIITNTTDRKALAKAIADELSTTSRYMGMPTCGYQIGDFVVDADGNALVPQPLELLLAIVDIVEVLHGYIEFVAVFLCGAQPLVGQVAAAHDDPSVAVWRKTLWQTEVELGMQVAGGMDAELQLASGDVVKHLQQ